jgi:hypothetical protein
MTRTWTRTSPWGALAATVFLFPSGFASVQTCIDDRFGDLTSVHDSVLSTTCTVPQTFAKGATHVCGFTAHFCGATHTDTVTGTLNDNDGGSLVKASNALTIAVSAVTQP